MEEETEKERMRERESWESRGESEEKAREGAQRRDSESERGERNKKGASINT